MVKFSFLAACERVTKQHRAQLNRNVNSLMLALNIVSLDHETIIYFYIVVVPYLLIIFNNSITEV